MGDNVMPKPEQVKPFLDRVLRIKDEAKERSKADSEDIGVIIGEASAVLQKPKAAIRAAINDAIAQIRLEQRQAKREDSNPDTALAYVQLAAAMGGDFGAWAKERAGSLGAKLEEEAKGVDPAAPLDLPQETSDEPPVGEQAPAAAE